MVAPLERLNGKSAEDLIQFYGLDEKIPVNLDVIFEDYGILLQATDFKELDQFPEIKAKENKKGMILGAVATKNDELKILYRKSDSVHRQKFTIAHELAYCCLDASLLAREGHIGYRIDIFGSSNDLKEIEANTFAGELLIPKSALMKIYSKISNPSLQMLAAAFDVSTNVMRERLNSLNLGYSENVSLFAYLH